MLRYCLDKYKTQEISEKIVDLLALKCVPDWCFTSKMIEKLYYAVFCNDDIVFSDIDIFAFFSSDISLSSINFNNVNLDDDNLDDCDPETINHVRLMA